MMPITFAETKAIFRAAEEATWTQGIYLIDADGWEDATHYLVARGTAEDDPNLVIIPDLVPLVSKETGRLSTWCRTCPRSLSDSMP